MDTTIAKGTLPLMVCHTVVECGRSDGEAAFSNTVSTVMLLLPRSSSPASTALFDRRFHSDQFSVFLSKCRLFEQFLNLSSVNSRAVSRQHSVVSQKVCFGFWLLADR